MNDATILGKNPGPVFLKKKTKNHYFMCFDISLGVAVNTFNLNVKLISYTPRTLRACCSQSNCI